MRLLLIRHGQTPHNVAGALDTAFPGAGLTRLGHAQARAVPAALRAESLAAIYATPLTRTQLTAAPLGDDRRLDVAVQPGLEEISAGDLEMRTDRRSVEAYVDGIAAWMHGDLGHRMPGGESGHEFAARYDAGVEAIAAGRAADETVALFSHGAAIRAYTVLRAVGLSVEEAVERRVLNTGMVALTGDPGSGWRVERWTAEPLGGRALLDADAHDVTGESVEDAAEAAVTGLDGD